MSTIETYFIGLATTYHDPALAIVDARGDVIFAEASERHLQSKRAILYPPDNFDYISEILKTYCNPKAHFVIAGTWSRKIQMILAFFDFFGFFSKERIRDLPQRGISRLLIDHDEARGIQAAQLSSSRNFGVGIASRLKIDFGNSNVRFEYFPHHLTHAANGCFSSPFDHASCLVVDGFGELGAFAGFRYKNQKLNCVFSEKSHASLGFFYVMLTTLCGFSHIHGEEWKVMGLAPYGTLNKDIYSIFAQMMHVEDLRLKYAPLKKLRFLYQKLQPFSRKSEQLPLAAADLACTGQKFFADIMLEIIQSFYATAPSENLVLSGGCALNSAFNGKILNQVPFKNLHIPSAPADDGNALGAAWLACQRYSTQFKREQKIQHPYLGSKVKSHALENFQNYSNAKVSKPDNLCSVVSQFLAEGKIVGWVQGRAEFGPRSLGNRSILADPRSFAMKDRINARVKFREEFRPFAPSILHEFGPEYFENYQASPYMDRTLVFRQEILHKVAAVAHFDFTGRLQSVTREWNERYYDLIKAFYDLTGVPILLNTSFNVMGKPIVHSVEDALSVFYTTGLDILVIEDFMVIK